MAKKATHTSGSKKQPAAVETSESIAEQTRLFLKSGKKIEVVQTGVSGQYNQPARKHINISKKAQ